MIELIAARDSTWRVCRRIGAQMITNLMCHVYTNGVDLVAVIQLLP